MLCCNDVSFSWQFYSYFTLLFPSKIFKNGITPRKQPFVILETQHTWSKVNGLSNSLFFTSVSFAFFSFASSIKLWHLYHFLWHINTTTNFFRQFDWKDDQVVTCSRCLRRFNCRCHRLQPPVEGGGWTEEEEEEGDSTATKDGIWPYWRDRKVLPLCWYDVWIRFKMDTFAKARIFWLLIFIFKMYFKILKINSLSSFQVFSTEKPSSQQIQHI